MCFSKKKLKEEKKKRRRNGLFFSFSFLKFENSHSFTVDHFEFWIPVQTHLNLHSGVALT